MSSGSGVWLSVRSVSRDGSDPSEGREVKLEQSESAVAQAASKLSTEGAEKDRDGVGTLNSEPVWTGVAFVGSAPARLRSDAIGDRSWAGTLLVKVRVVKMSS